VKVEWQFDRASEVHPVICGCEYCTAHNAQYVFQADTVVEIHIREFSFYRQIQQGTKTAVFHECLSCGMLVCVTVDSGGQFVIHIIPGWDWSVVTQKGNQAV
tara:strand:- start:2324 stop:2629 length:306 start_codon:yes stop_codon:yes gene_type:complete